MTRTGSGSAPAGREHGQTFRRNEVAKIDLFQPVSLSRAKPDRTVLQQDQQCRRVATRCDRVATNIWPSSNSLRSEFGCVLMSPRPGCKMTQYLRPQSARPTLDQQAIRSVACDSV